MTAATFSSILQEFKFEQNRGNITMICKSAGDR